MLILSRQACNAIYRNYNEAHVFCSSLSFQQAPTDVRTSNRSRVIAGFVFQRMRGARRSGKKGETLSMFGSMGSVKPHPHLQGVYFKSHHCNFPYGASGRCTSVLSTCYLTDRCLTGRMTMHACQIGPTDTIPPCLGSP